MTLKIYYQLWRLQFRQPLSHVIAKLCRNKNTFLINPITFSWKWSLCYGLISRWVFESSELVPLERRENPCHIFVSGLLFNLRSWFELKICNAVRHWSVVDESSITHSVEYCDSNGSVSQINRTTVGKMEKAGQTELAALAFMRPLKQLRRMIGCAD